MDTVTWRTLQVHADHRGSVYEPLDDSLLSHQHHLHVVVNKPGAVRGNHYHGQAVEIISVSGPAKVCYQNGGIVETVLVDAGVVLCFRFPPGVAHAIKNTGTGDQVLVAFTDIPHNPLAPDTFPQPLIKTESGESP